MEAIKQPRSRVPPDSPKPGWVFRPIHDGVIIRSKCENSPKGEILWPGFRLNPGELCTSWHEIEIAENGLLDLHPESGYLKYVNIDRRTRKDSHRS
jgi:hypothetical protein